VDNNQKLENQLNLAFETSESERQKSLDLNVGYNTLENTWEAILKYNGNLNKLRNANIEVIELMNNYAIIRGSASSINQIAMFEEVIYIEKPKRLNFTILQGKRSSCISELQSLSPDSLKLFGEGVFIAIIDSGIDYRHEAFINNDGTSKIYEIWDQSVGDGENNYNIGTIYTNEMINEALSNNVRLQPETADFSGHGTAVASIASGVAPNAKLLIVKLGRNLPNSFPRTSELMMAVDYCVNKGVELNVPIVINMSFGNNYGAHNGNTLLETFIDQAALVGKTSIVVGTGNEGIQGIHQSFVLTDDVFDSEISVPQYETGFNIQIWKNYGDEVSIQLISPSGKNTGNIEEVLGVARYSLDETNVLMYYGEPVPYSKSQEIFLDFIPKESYVESGIWTIRFIPRRIIDGQINMWLPTGSSLNGTTFLRPSINLTLTIPSTAENVISVGAYNSFNDSYANFSGRGVDVMNLKSIVKPDLVAPGVNIRCANVGGGYGLRSGTSMAAPFVSGAVACLNEWGIIRGNDRFLYGEKVKAYLIKGARQLPGEQDVPNPRTGFGALCVANSLPV